MPVPVIAPNASASADLVNKAYVDAVATGGGISVVRVQVTLNALGRATITNAAVTTTSNISLFRGVTVDTEENDYDMDPVEWSVVSRAAGSFVIQALHPFFKHTVRGSFWVNYIRS